MSGQTVVAVPANTMLADLDEGLERLLLDQFEQLGFDGVDVVFDAPNKQWSAQVTRPTVNLFLYDVRRSQKPGQTGSESARANGRPYDRPPSLRVDCFYAITVWSKAVVDEHRLLSQVLGILYAFPVLDGQLGPRMTDGSQRFTILASVGEQRGEQRADFWRSVDGHYKPALDYVVTLSVESGQVVERGPDVRTTTVRSSLAEGGARAGLTELHTLGGTVRDAAGAPVAGAWVTVADLGRMVVSDDDGRFRLPRLSGASHTVRVRDGAGREAALDVDVPHSTLDVVMPAGR
jgi:hypothetical protein